MKSPLMLCLFATSLAASPPMSDPVSADTITRLQQNNPVSALVPPAPEDAGAIRPTDQSIIKQSVILHDGKNWTLVPKGAVVHLPAKLSDKVDVKPVGNLLTWAAFFAINQNWITTNEVTFEQAAGNVPLPAERAEAWGKINKVVVAVHQGGPISVNIAETTKDLTQR